MDARINIASAPPLPTQPTTKPLYSITTHDNYEFPMMTMTETKIKYYVKSPDEFDKKYPNDTPAREHVENQIVDEYLEFARKRCNYEEKQHMLRPDFPTPVCDRLENMTIQS